MNSESVHIYRSDNGSALDRERQQRNDTCAGGSFGGDHGDRVLKCVRKLLQHICTHIVIRILCSAHGIVNVGLIDGDRKLVEADVEKYLRRRTHNKRIFFRELSGVPIVNLIAERLAEIIRGCTRIRILLPALARFALRTARFHFAHRTTPQLSRILRILQNTGADRTDAPRQSADYLIEERNDLPPERRLVIHRRAYLRNIAEEIPPHILLAQLEVHTVRVEVLTVRGIRLLLLRPKLVKAHPLFTRKLAQRKLTQRAVVGRGLDRMSHLRGNDRRDGAPRRGVHMDRAVFVISVYRRIVAAEEDHAPIEYVRKLLRRCLLRRRRTVFAPRPRRFVHRNNSRLLRRSVSLTVKRFVAERSAVVRVFAVNCKIAFVCVFGGIVRRIGNIVCGIRCFVRRIRGIFCRVLRIYTDFCRFILIYADFCRVRTVHVPVRVRRIIFAFLRILTVDSGVIL